MLKVINTQLSHGSEYELKNPYEEYQSSEWFDNHGQGPHIGENQILKVMHFLLM